MPSSHAYKINHRRRYPKGEEGGVKGDECHSSKSSSSINYSFQCYPRVFVIILIRLNFSQEFWAPNDPFACIRNWSKKKSKVILRKRVSIDKNLSVISFSFKKFFQKNEQDDHDEEKVWQQCSLLHVFNCNKIIKLKKNQVTHESERQICCVNFQPWKCKKRSRSAREHKRNSWRSS